MQNKILVIYSSLGSGGVTRPCRCDNIYFDWHIVNEVSLKSGMEVCSLRCCFFLGFYEQVRLAARVSPPPFHPRCCACNPADEPCSSVQKNEKPEGRDPPPWPFTQSLVEAHAANRNAPFSDDGNGFSNVFM